MCVAISGVAAWLGVDPGTVTKWYDRYPEDEMPAPDFVAPARFGSGVERFCLDSAERKQEWIDWNAARPGQGRPGQPKPRREKTADASA